MTDLNVPFNQHDTATIDAPRLYAVRAAGLLKNNSNLRGTTNPVICFDRRAYLALPTDDRRHVRWVTDIWLTGDHTQRGSGVESDRIRLHSLPHKLRSSCF
jgi:hypothetical protein